MNMLLFSLKTSLLISNYFSNNRGNNPAYLMLHRKLIGRGGNYTSLTSSFSTVYNTLILYVHWTYLLFNNLIMALKLDLCVSSKIGFRGQLDPFFIIYKQSFGIHGGKVVTYMSINTKL